MVRRRKKTRQVSVSRLRPGPANKKAVKGGLMSVAEYETIEQVAERIDKWVEQTGVSVINIETVICPYKKFQHMWYTTGGNTVDTWQQFVRVWYDDSPK